MAYSKKQLSRILKVNGRDLIHPDHPLPFAARVAESLIRRRVYAYEDETVAQQWHMYRAAFNDIRSRALDLAQQQGVDSLELSGRVLAWRRAWEAYTQQRLAALSQQIALHTLKRAGDMFLLGYYGRGYVVDMATKPDVHPNLRTPNVGTITKDILHPGLSEAFNPDQTIYDLLGKEWRQTYSDQLDDLVRRIRGTLTTSIQQKLNLNLTMKAVADVMGINISRSQGFKSNFDKVQTLTRTYVMGASNQGAEELYRQNGQYLQGIQFLAANDMRVCPPCEALNGTVWPLDSSEIVRPPSDTHSNCRCTLIPVLLPSEAGDETQAPAQTWNNWVTMLGLGWMGAELINIQIGGELDSSQVDDESDYEVVN